MNAHEFLTKMGVDSTNVDAVIRYVKDEMPAEGRPTSGFIYENGPFSPYNDTVHSLIVGNSSALMRWLPTETIKSRAEVVNHLQSVSPTGFDGSTTYSDFLRAAGSEIDECNYGPTVTWSGFAYQMFGGSFSWRTNQMQVYRDGGLPYYQQQPLYNAAGQSVPLSTDREWAIARLLLATQSHMNYVVREGDAANSKMEWDGLSTILRPGYVTSRKVGSGNPRWAEPVFTNAAGFTSAQLLTAIRNTVKRISNRIQARNMAVGPADIVIVMSSAMWDALAIQIAQGALWSLTNTNIDINMTYSDFRAEYNNVKTGGLGYGVLPVDNRPYPVITEQSMGVNVTIDKGSGVTAPGVSGDIYVLTRRADGMNLLAQQYVDWNQVDYVTGTPENMVQLPNGLLRAGYVTEANKCYYYYMEAAGRVVTRMQPMQGVIRNAVVETQDADTVEGPDFTSPNYYAFNGALGGTGASVL